MTDCIRSAKNESEPTAKEILVRNYAPSDYSELFRLLNAVYHSGISQKDLEAHYLGPDKEIIVAVRGDRFLGCAFLHYITDYVRPGHTVFVTYVAVDESIRHNGIGRTLFSEIESRALKQGCSAIELTSADSRTDAHAFYNALHFTKKKTTVFIKEVV